MPNLSTFASSTSELVTPNSNMGVGVCNSLITVQRAGTGLGNYLSASTSYVDVDSTNLTFTARIPSGFVASISASGVLGVTVASGVVGVAIADSGVVLQE